MLISTAGQRTKSRSQAIVENIVIIVYSVLSGILLIKLLHLLRIVLDYVISEHVLWYVHLFLVKMWLLYVLPMNYGCMCLFLLF